MAFITLVGERHDSVKVGSNPAKASPLNWEDRHENKTSLSM